MARSVAMLPGPLAPEHPLNHGTLPIYVYDTQPIGGRHFNQARVAHWFGAKHGHQHGPSGETYGLPTTDRFGHPMAWPELEAMIRELADIAADNPDRGFMITKIGGCRSAAYLDERRIAECFLENDPGNFHLAGSWVRLRRPDSRRICIASPYAEICEEDLRVIEWILARLNPSESEIIAPGMPLWQQAAQGVADQMGWKIRLVTHPSAQRSILKETLAWYADTALIIKPSTLRPMDELEREQARRLESFSRTVIANHIAHRAIISGAGMRSITPSGQ